MQELKKYMLLLEDDLTCDLCTVQVLLWISVLSSSNKYIHYLLVQDICAGKQHCWKKIPPARWLQTTNLLNRHCFPSTLYLCWVSMFKDSNNTLTKDPAFKWQVIKFVKPRRQQAQPLWAGSHFCIKVQWHDCIQLSESSEAAHLFSRVSNHRFLREHCWYIWNCNVMREQTWPPHVNKLSTQ